MTPESNDTESKTIVETSPKSASETQPMGEEGLAPPEEKKRRFKLPKLPWPPGLLVIQVIKYGPRQNAGCPKPMYFLPWRHWNYPFSALSCPSCLARTSRIGILPARRTRSATLPRSHRPKPVRPWVHIAIRSM